MLEYSYRVKENTKGKKYRLRLGLLVLAGCGIGFVLGYTIKPETQIVSAQSIRETTDQYRFIHPLLAVGRPNIEVASPIYAPLQRSIQKFITDQTSSGLLKNASVYFINYGKSGSLAIN